MIKIIKQGEKKEKKIETYKLECKYCGCIFTFNASDVLWREKRLDGYSGIKCPSCNCEIKFKDCEVVEE